MKTQFISYALFVALCCMLSLPGYAQDEPTVISPALPATPASVPVGPTTVIDIPESTYDFGTIKEGTLVQHVFTFTNKGDEPLILSDAKGSCGCTVPMWPRGPIAPGETASITVEFNSKNKRGRRSQRVTLTANTNPAQTFLYLTGDVNPQDKSEVYIPDFEAEVETAIDPSCFAIYPNPTAELLRLDMENHLGEVAIISIYSKTGQLMAERQIESVNGVIEFNVSHYPAGTYIANVQVEGKKPEARCFVVVE